MTWRRRRVPSAAMSPLASGSVAEAPSASGTWDGSSVGASTGASGVGRSAAIADGSGRGPAGSARAPVAGSAAGSRRGRGHCGGSISRPDAEPAGSARGARPPTSQPSPERGRNPTVTRPPGVNSIRSPAWAIASSYWTPGWSSPTCSAAFAGAGPGASAAGRGGSRCRHRHRAEQLARRRAGRRRTTPRRLVGVERSGRPGRRGAERVVTAVLG